MGNLCISCGNKTDRRCDAALFGLECGAFLCRKCRHTKEHQHVPKKALFRSSPIEVPDYASNLNKLVFCDSSPIYWGKLLPEERDSLPARVCGETFTVKALDGYYQIRLYPDYEYCQNDRWCNEENTFVDASYHITRLTAPAVICPIVFGNLSVLGESLYYDGNPRVYEVVWSYGVCGIAKSVESDIALIIQPCAYHRIKNQGLPAENPVAIAVGEFNASKEWPVLKYADAPLQGTSKFSSGRLLYRYESDFNI